MTISGVCWYWHKAKNIDLRRLTATLPTLEWEAFNPGLGQSAKAIEWLNPRIAHKSIETLTVDMIYSPRPRDSDY